jgi:ribosomal-protein-alanine N-acetyltransferase
MSAGETSALRFVAAGPAHVAQLAALHGECFATGWSEASFAELMRAGAEAWLALAGDQPVALAVARVVAGEGEIITIGVAPEARQRGVARRLLGHALAAAAEAGCRMMFLEVGCGNAPALALYRAAGFHEVGRRPAYYQENEAVPEDAVIMRKDY